MSNEKGLLTVSFGSSLADPGGAEAVEEALRSAFPDRAWYRAWTSGMLRGKAERERGIKVFSVEEALVRASGDGIRDLLVQPTHLLPGEELQKAHGAVSAYAGSFEKVSMGQPLICSERDAEEAASAIESIYADIPDGELLALMGHGSSFLKVPVYDLLEKRFRLDGFANAVIGTVEAQPGIEPVLERIRRDRPSRVHLAPLLLSAGGHVLYDMCGDGEDSWKNRISREGTEVICHTKGLGEYAQVRDMYVRHALCAKTITGEDTEWT